MAISAASSGPTSCGAPSRGIVCVAAELAIGETRRPRRGCEGAQSVVEEGVVDLYFGFVDELGGEGRIPRQTSRSGEPVEGGGSIPRSFIVRGRTREAREAHASHQE